MIISLTADENIKTTEIIGKRLKGLLKRAIKEGRYNSQQAFFDILNERLKKVELLEDSHVDMTNYNTYAKYLNGRSNLKMYVFKEICEELDCSPAYLLGLTVVNSDPTGTILKFINDLGEDVTVNIDDDTDCIYIDYHGTELHFEVDELTKKIQDLVDATLFVEAKKVKK